MGNTVSKRELYRVVMTAIIYDDSKRYLVTRRSPSQKVFPNLWTVPGGGLEPRDYEGKPKTTEDAWYEVVERALKREVREEVGIEIGKPAYLTDLIFVRPDGIHVLVLSYYARYESGEVTLDSSELVEHRWVTLEEAHELDFISGIYEEVERVDAIIGAQGT